MSLDESGRKLPFAPLAQLYGRARVADVLKRCKENYDRHVQTGDLQLAAESMQAINHWGAELAKFK